jgi:hypothetical protein
LAEKSRFREQTTRPGIAESLGDNAMIYFMSVLIVLALLVGAIAVIWATLREHSDAVMAALAGRSIRARTADLPTRYVRVTVKPSARRLRSFQPLRAAA